MSIRTGDIFWADLEIEANSHVQGGHRPVYIIQCNEDLDGNEIVTVASITSQMNKFGLPVHYYLGEYLEEHSFVMFEQLNTLQVNQLESKICTLSRAERDEADLRFLFSIGYYEDALEERKMYHWLKDENNSIRKSLGLPVRKKNRRTA
ncbi:MULTISPECIES: type II toxin-antitoxin system PemK/MazF family toxin [Brevibacillus]|uniref:type II toxin-antitoxin system PemK/MazF family toxin n=1 Tax=Brevibacillus TaxID=55080 RepID=UPI0006915ACA|nr:type II toxin-antitoxin system PemK/MazF family toxin [Brevibacillus borstelensis]